MSCVRGCCETQAAHYKSVALFGPSARRDAERREAADMHAYKRLVQSGVQPSKIDGAAELERVAESKIEVERAHIITDRRARNLVDAATSEIATPVTKPLSP